MNSLENSHQILKVPSYKHGKKLAAPPPFNLEEAI